jgi:hypothetical protein
VELFIINVIIIIAIASVAKFKYGREFTFVEFGVVVSINAFVVGVLILAGSYNDYVDTEILTGVVESKERRSVSCEHSYSCNCRPVSCGKNCTTMRCDTCYLHPNDWDYVVNSDVGHTKIKRVDSRGVEIPSRFDSVVVGESFSTEHFFTNYIKAAPDSLFNRKDVVDSGFIPPKYPNVFDYYRFDRVIDVDSGIAPYKIQQLRVQLDKLGGELGPTKHVNIIVVLATGGDTYFRNLQNSWIGGKQNDLIVVINVKDDMITYSNAFGFSVDNLVFEKLAHDIRDVGEFDANKVVGIISEDTKKYFTRKSMETYEYLADTIDPPLWVVLLGYLISIFGSLFASMYLSRPGVNLSSEL